MNSTKNNLLKWRDYNTVGLLLLLTCIVATDIATADEYHYNNILIGDRAAGLAGAYVAVSDDPAGLFYNPAGIIHSVGSNISGSMNALHNVRTIYKNALGGQYDWVRDSSILSPNFFGVFQPFAGGKVGFSYAVTDSVFENQDQEFFNVTTTAINPVTNYVINFNNQNSTYNIGPSFSLKFYDNLSAGVTVYFRNRTQEIVNNQMSVLGAPTNDYEWLNTYQYKEEYGINTIFGMMWTPLDKISVGVTMSKVSVFNANYSLQSSCKSALLIDPSATAAVPSCPTDPVIRTIQNSDEKKKHPLKISHGIAYFPNSRLLISSDLVYHSATPTSSSTINFSIGSEYYLNSEWAVRGGFYTNVANTPELRTTGVTTTQAPHVDLYGISLSLSHFTRNSVLSAGINTMTGSGKAQLFPAVGGVAQLSDVEIYTMTLFMSATYSY